MPETPELERKSTDDVFGVVPPQLALPKGGGAIRGIGEKFAANPVTGTGSLTVPIYTSPGRSGFGPQLSLSYDSGAGNGPFGLGWSLGLPSITRKTDKGLPQYLDREESDTFVLSGAEDLVRVLVQNNGAWNREEKTRRTVYGQQYAVCGYLPRIEGLFARIERWTNLNDAQDTFWRSISKNNITTWYGRTAESRIYDPADPSRIFSWLICESYDDKGNVIVYRYKSEDSDGIDLSQAHERNRSDATRSANRYLKRVLYGNATPYSPDLTGAQAVPLPSEWFFELVFDHGEHDAAAPVPQESKPWSCREDPFSTYRATFEIRTYRLCRRVLMFHHFANEPGVGLNCLVRSTDFAHSQPSQLSDPSKPFYSFLQSATQTGYRRNPDRSYLSKAMPPLEFTYTEAVIDETVREVDAESLENVPSGLDGTRYQWADLDGEGLSGILTRQGNSWWYKPNLSPTNLKGNNGSQRPEARFGALQTVVQQPSFSESRRARQQLMALSGDGQLDLVEFDSATPGYFERTAEEDWAPFKPFSVLPRLNWQNPNLKFVDLTGDGLSDLLIAEAEEFVWHNSLAGEGFAPGVKVQQSSEEEKGPKLIFADSTESVFLADLSGDGLTDLVRIRQGEVCYWSNRGYGRFGPKVTMDNAPWFESPELFDGRRIRLADIDGSGTSDIVYLASSGVHLYFNQSGNSWGERRVLEQFPKVENLSSTIVLDLLGNGTACLTWSSPLPENTNRSLRYVDLMSGQKPHLLVSVVNNLGAETRVQYASSPKFYVADKLAGTPWLTRIPFPVHVVERVETYDYISRNRFVTRYAYHHGFYDGVEREFRGFARVDQWDTEEFATLSESGNFPNATNIDVASYVPPVLTKTWFHTGAFFDESLVSRHLAREYYSEGNSSDAVAGLTDTLLPATVFLSDGTRIPYDLTAEETREACRALRGSILRQEIYGLDGSDKADRPYSVSERNYTIEVLQPQGPNRYAAFFTHARETIDFHYERKLFQVLGNTLVEPNTALPAGAREAADPRVSHGWALAVNRFGNMLTSAAVAYGRRYLDPALTPADQAKQSTTLSTYSENSYTNPILDEDAYRTPLPAESSTYELIQVMPDGVPDSINLFIFDELQAKIQAAANGKHDIQYEDLNHAGVTTSDGYRRLITRTRTLYRPDDMGSSSGDSRALLSTGILQSLALLGCSYKLAFTPGLIPQAYQRAGAALLPNPGAVLGSVAADGGGYVDLDGDGHWWIPSGRMFYSEAPGSPNEEKNQALQHFFLPRRFEDQFGNATTIGYDLPYDLLVASTSDAVANTVMASNDYRALQPALVTDPNGNRAAVTFDTLGMVTGTAVMGKANQTLGDSLSNFLPDLTDAEIEDFYQASDPHVPAQILIAGASTRLIYDLDRFLKSRTEFPTDTSKWKSVFAATISRETHASDVSTGLSSKLQVVFSYSDGYGREIQKKLQAEPGPIVDRGPSISPRWVGSGWTIFNNKGQPVRQYEPFFSQLSEKRHQFEFDTRVGVGAICCYDPAGRIAATIHPNHAYDKVLFDPWREESWDVNDTILQNDPRLDNEVGDFFKRLLPAEFLPTWYDQRAGGRLGTGEQDAANKTKAHAKTPTTTYFDPFGRVFLTVVDNAGDGKYPTRVELDIQDNQRFVTDALGRKVTVYDYDLVQNRIHQANMEAGERWMLNDVAGHAIRTWDSRGHNFRTKYDAVRRHTQLFVVGTDTSSSDAKTLLGEVLFEEIVYGEGQQNDKSLNLRTRIFQHRDTAGIVTNMGDDPISGQLQAYDFKGNLLCSCRRFAADHKSLPDWSGGDPSLLEAFTSCAKYDALNRPIAARTPDGSVFHYIYNEANLLKSLTVQVRGAASSTIIVKNIDYNAKGQRALIEYGNDTATSSLYDPLTFRLVNISTSRSYFPTNQSLVQDLSYTFDPVGNITFIQDSADLQNVVFFRNNRVEPSNDYTYDAIYRLSATTGREHLGQNGNGRPLTANPTTYNNIPRTGLLQPGDGNAMGHYDESYAYDALGNLLQVAHRSSDPGNPGWSRTYSYNEPSLLEAGKANNRLTRTTVGDGQQLNEDYTYDIHGEITCMPHLRVLQWDFNDTLTMTQRQAVNTTDEDGIRNRGERTYQVYDSAGRRVRKITESPSGFKKNERFYLDGFELYREFDVGGEIKLARETLHVLDDTKRIALIETKTIDVKAPANSLPSGTIRYQFANHLGTACVELDEQGALISYEEYYPYGGTSYQAGRTAVEVSLKRYRYIGKERDEETGFYYLGARHYADWLGRWISPDPLGIAGGLNLFSYASGNPVIMVDKSGLAPQKPEALAEEFTRNATLNKYKQAGPAVDITPVAKHVNNPGVDVHIVAGEGEGAVNIIGDVKHSNVPSKSGGSNVFGGKVSSFENAAKNEHGQLVRNIREARRTGKLDPKTAYHAIDNAKSGHVLHELGPSGYNTGVSKATLAKHQASVTPGEQFADAVAHRQSLEIKKTVGPAPKVSQAEANKIGDEIVANLGKAGGEGTGQAAKVAAHETEKEALNLVKTGGKEVLGQGEKLGLKQGAKLVGSKAAKFIPFVGIAVGAYLVQDDLRKGDYAAAAWDTAEAIPVVGDVVGAAHLGIIAGGALNEGLGIEKVASEHGAAVEGAAKWIGFGTDTSRVFGAIGAAVSSITVAPDIAIKRMIASRVR